MDEELLTPQQFATKIKEKYPQYKDIDDIELTNRMLEKYPQYKDMIRQEEERSFLGAIPVIGTAIHYGAKELENVVTKDIPNTLETLRIQGQSGRLKELQHLQAIGFDTPGLQAEVQQHQTEIPELVKSVQTRKAEAHKLLEHNIQNLTDVKSVSDFMNWFGTSVSQAGGQIPLAVATAGQSSFLMEAAEVYDTQLDLLSNKLGLSKEQIILQGLDKPAEGQAYAILAGAMDAVSAGKIMNLFKNIGKKPLKDLAKKEVKKSILKEALADGAFEAVTEGTQGQLEQFGASRGAGTEYNFDPKQFLNEAAAGAVGGVGIGMASNNLENITTKKDVHPAKAAIENYEKAIDSISTGDPDLDASLDEISESTAREIDALWEKTHLIAGTKTQEELKTIREENTKLKLEKYRTEQEQLGKILRGELTQLPALPHPNFKTEETTVPKYNPQTLEEEGTQAAHKFDFQLPHGSAQGTIVGPYASLDTIYANKDEQGNPIKGKNLYGTLLNQLKIQGIKTLTVGNQTPASANALKKLVDNGELTIDSKGDVTFGAKTIHTRFNIAKPYEQQIETERTPEARTSEESAPSEEIQSTPEISEEKQLLTEEKQQDLEIILKKRLENAKKRAPSRRLAAIEKVIEKAEKAGLNNFAKVADEESKKAFEEVQAKEEEKQELKELKTKRAETKAAKAAEVKPIIEKKPSKLEAKIEGTQVALKTAKEAFLRDIAYLRESGNPEYKKRAEQYLKFRKKQGLKEITLDKALSESKAEHYIQRAQSRIAKETSRGHAISQRIKQMTKEGASAEEISKVKESLEHELKKEVQKSLGVDLDMLTGANLDKLLSNPEFIYSVRNLTGEGIKKNRLKHSSVEELSRRLSNLPDTRANDIITLLHTVNKSLVKEGKSLNILSYHNPTPHTSGFYARGKKQDILLIASKLDPSGNFSIENKDALNTVLHELTHTLSDLLSRLPLQGDRSYSRDLGELYDKSKFYLESQVVNIVNKEIDGKSLNEHELNLMAAIFSNIEKFYGRSRVEFIDRAIREKSDPHVVGKAIVNSLYGFSNKNEMASEALASYKFARLLDLIPYTGKLETTKSENKTILTALFDKIAKVLNKYVGKFFPGKSSFNVFNDILETYVNQLESEPNLQKFNPYFYAPTLRDIERQYPKLSKKEVIAKREEIAAKMVKDESSVGFSKKVASGEFTEEIVSNISRTLENRTEIKTVADVRDYIDRVNKRLTTEKQLGHAYADVIFKKVQVMRRRKQLTKTFVNNTLTKARQSEKYQTSFKYKKDVDDFQSVNIDAVPQSRITDLRQAVDALSRNMLVSEDGYNIMINYGKKLAKVKALVKIAPKIDQHVNLGGLLGTEQLSNASTFSTILGRYDKATSTEILRHIYGGMMETFAHVGTEAHKFTTDLSKIADKYNLTHSNLSKIAMYGSIFSTKNDPRNTNEWEKEVLDNAKFALESAINKKTAREQSNYKGDLNRKEIDKEIEIATDLYDKLKKKTSMDNILDKGETEFYNHFTKFAKDHEQDFFRNSFGAWGSDIEPRFNYFPTMAQGKVNGVLSNENDELIRNNKDNLFEALGLHDIKSDKSAVYAKKSNSQYKRQNPKGYFYNFDAMNIAERWSKNMLYDLYATTELKALNRLFKDSEFRKNINVKTTDAFVKQIRSIAGVGNKYDSELPAFFKVMGNLYTATLATSGQIFNQSSSGFAAAAVIAAHGGLNAPRNFAKAVSAAFSSTFSTDTSKLNQFMKDNGLGIQVRDILFEKYLGSDDYKSYLGSKLQKFRNTMQNMTEWSLRKGDKLGARVVWFAAYFNAGGTLEKPNKEAILEAERQVGIMQNMSDMNFSAPLFKYDNMYKKILMGMFYAYKSFAVNAYVNLLYSAKNINKPEAREAMGAQLASVVAYHAIAASLVKPLIYDPLINALTGGDDDDKDKEEKRYSLGQQIIAESLWDLGAFTPLFGMASPGISDATFRWLFSETLAKKIYEDESGVDAYNKYLDNPIYSMKNAEDIWKQAFGPGYREMGETTIAAMQYIKMQADADEFFVDMEKADKAEKALEELEWRLGATLYAATPTAPFGGDIKRIIQARLRKQKARNLSGTPIGNTNGEMDSEGTESIEGTPEIQERNYEIVNE